MNFDSTPVNTAALSDDEMQIDLWKVVKFFLNTWKRLAAGALLGLVIALVIWFIFGNYRAQLQVPNRWGEALSLRYLENTWAAVADQTAQEDQLSPEERSFYKKISSSSWWRTNVLPIYVITKSDLKEMVGSAEVKGSPIMSFMITWTGKSQEDLEKNIVKVSNFMLIASSYASLCDLLNTYESENFSINASIEKEIHAIEVALIYAKRRLANLEELQSRFPSNALVTNQVVDPKDAGAKYLPIITQVIAVKSDIFTSQESMRVLRDRLVQAQLLNQFIEQAKPLIFSDRNSMKLAIKMLEIEARLRQTIAADNYMAFGVLDRIKVDLLRVQSQFSPQIQAPLSIVVRRSSSWVAAAAGGLFGGFLLALLICLGMYFWPKVKVRLQSLEDAH